MTNANQTLTFKIGRIEVFQPQQPGALGGHVAKCSCGTEVRTSLSRHEAMLQVAMHANWHIKRGDVETY